MRKNDLGEIILDQDDVCDLMLQGRDVLALRGLTVEPSLVPAQVAAVISDPGEIMTWITPTSDSVSQQQFDLQRQSQWFMPQAYRDLDIAQHVLSLCQEPAQLQRAGQELMMYQERDLFDLLRYLKYLVDVMREHGIIWGVGRGSSVSSYVLYLLGVHKIDSLFYDLEPSEFLR